MQLKVENGIFTNKTFYKEMKISVFIVWLIISLTVFIALITFYFNDSLFLSKPICMSKKNNSTCILCGMSHAIKSLFHGNINASYVYNKLSVPLFLAVLFNQIIFLYFTVKQLSYFINNYLKKGGQ